MIFKYYNVRMNWIMLFLYVFSKIFGHIDKINRNEVLVKLQLKIFVFLVTNFLYYKINNLEILIFYEVTILLKF